MSRLDVQAVRTVLDDVAAEQPDRVDRRPSGNLPPRYIDGGEPACLVAVILARLGVSTGVLRALDKEATREGAGIRLEHSRHPVRRKFTEDAWALLAFLQRRNDSSASWSRARQSAFRIDPYWREVNPKFAFPGPWCTAGNAIEEDR